MNLLKTLAEKNWGSNHDVLCNTYKALIQSKLDYGCIAYNSESESTLNKLNALLLNISMRIATGVFTTSPTLAS